MEKQYSLSESKDFRLVGGDIAEFKGGAIVVPVYEYNRIREDAKLFRAYHHGFSQPPNANAIIVATCYINEEGIPFYVKAATTTANALEVAKDKRVESIAFPALMTERRDVRLEEIVPAMIDEFVRHVRQWTHPREISLCIPESEAYNIALQIADIKLR